MRNGFWSHRKTWSLDSDGCFRLSAASSVRTSQSCGHWMRHIAGLDASDCRGRSDRTPETLRLDRACSLSLLVRVEPLRHARLLLMLESDAVVDALEALLYRPLGSRRR